MEQQPPLPPPSLDEVDTTRHREIMSKAVSAILLLTLKWFKVSREHFSYVNRENSINMFLRYYEVSLSWAGSSGVKLLALDP